MGNENEAPIREQDRLNGVTWRGFLEKMPYDRNGLHATGYEVILSYELGYWDEYYNPKTRNYEYYR